MFLNGVGIRSGAACVPGFSRKKTNRLSIGRRPPLREGRNTMIAKEYSWLVHKLCGRADRQATGRDTIVMPPITGAIRRPGTLADAQLARTRVDVESESTSLRLTAALMNAQRSSSRQVICQRHDERNMHCDLYVPCTIPAESIFPRPREHAGRRRRNYHTATASLR